MMYRKGPQNEVNVSEVDKGTVREHLVGLDHAAKLRPDTFKGGLDVVVPVDVFHGGDNDSYQDQNHDEVTKRLFVDTRWHRLRRRRQVKGLIIKLGRRSTGT